MNALDLALDIIARFEGFRSEPYQDSGGVWTIGYGSTRDPSGNPVGPGTPAVDEATARQWMSKDVQGRMVQVRDMVKGPLADHELAALTSFAYNEGIGGLKRSTLLRYLNQNRRAEAAGEFGKWIWAGHGPLMGLARRRAAEMVLFTGG